MNEEEEEEEEEDTKEGWSSFLSPLARLEGRALPSKLAILTRKDSHFDEKSSLDSRT